MYTVNYQKNGSLKTRNKHFPTLKEARAWLRCRWGIVKYASVLNRDGYYLNVI